MCKECAVSACGEVADLMASYYSQYEWLPDSSAARPSVDDDVREERLDKRLSSRERSRIGCNVREICAAGNHCADCSWVGEDCRCEVLCAVQPHLLDKRRILAECVLSVDNVLVLKTELDEVKDVVHLDVMRVSICKET